MTTAVKNVRVVLRALGGREGIELVHDEVPPPAEGQVRVKVTVSGVSQADITIRHGMYPEGAALPFTLGYDLVGTVEALGPGVTRWAVGDRVAAITVRGAHTHFLNWSADDLFSVPAGVTDQSAVALVLNGMTAYQVLHRWSHVKAGQQVLVQSAAGGVGSLLCQLAVAAGARVMGSASAAKHDFVRGLGAKPIDWRRADFVEAVRAWSQGGVDLVIDGVGGDSFGRSYASVRRGGHFVGIGFSSQMEERWGRLTTFARFLRMLATPDGKRASFFGIMRVKHSHPDWFRDDLAALYALAEHGTVMPTIHGALPMTEVTRAHELVEQGAVVGKLVLVHG